jgi:hypothetical protein
LSLRLSVVGWEAVTGLLEVLALLLNLIQPSAISYFRHNTLHKNLSLGISNVRTLLQ